MRIVFFISYILSSIILPAQSKEIIPDKLDYFFADISINNPLPAGYKLPFSSIEIIDYRPDTSKIGFIRNNPNSHGNKAYKIIVTKNGLRQSLTDLLNRYYKSCFSNDSLQLVIVVKRFWADPYPNRNIQQQGNAVRSSVFDMHLRLEFFLKKDNWYYPVKRTDTVFQTGEGGVVPGCSGGELRKCEMYGYAVSKVFENTDFNYYADRLDKPRSKLTAQGLDSFNKKYSDYPVVHAETLNKGVYLNFNEFRQNKPSVIKYKVEEIKKKDRTMYVVYDTSNAEPVRIANYWGYCNGENIYCGYYMKHPLIKTGNTFEFFIDRLEYHQDYTVVSGPYGTMYIPSQYKNKALEPVQIDMETGKIY